MTGTELKEKIKKYHTELKSDIEKFVEDNAEFKIGDLVTRGSLADSFPSYFVIRRVGYDWKGIVVYYANKVVKSTGEVSFMDMNSGVGTTAESLKKATLKVKGKEISFIEKSSHFDYSIRIDVRI